MSILPFAHPLQSRSITLTPGGPLEHPQLGLYPWLCMGLSDEERRRGSPNPCAPFLLTPRLHIRCILCPHDNPKDSEDPHLTVEETKAQRGQHGGDRDWFQSRALSLTNSATSGELLKFYGPQPLTCQSVSRNFCLLCICYVSGWLRGDGTEQAWDGPCSCEPHSIEVTVKLKGAENISQGRIRASMRNGTGFGDALLEEKR